MNEPFVNGSAAINQWSHEQISYKRQRDMQPGYKNNQKIEPVIKSEEQAKKEREDFWTVATEDIQNVDFNQVLIKQS
jgi:hypothetical protein